MAIQWRLEKRSLSQLKDHPKNPRKLSKHDAEQLKTSLDKFGVADKPIINTDGTLIGGHQRKRVLKQLGYEEIECWVPDRTLSEEEIDEFNIRLNRNLGEWNWDILANEWDEALLLASGFEEAELVGPKSSTEEKKKKPKIVLEFDKEDDLRASFEAIENLASTIGAILKVKV